MTSTAKNIWIVCPSFPPTVCGVGAHTAKIVRELATICPRWQWHVCTTSPQVTGYPAEPCLTQPNTHLYNTITTWKGPLFHRQFEDTIAQATPDMVIVQYTPHLYDRLGINLDLPRVVNKLAQQKIPVFLMAHELFVPLDFCLRHWITGPVQRWMLRELLYASAGMFISTDRRLKQLEKRYPGQVRKFHYLPVTSNIDRVSITPDEKQMLRARWCQSPDEKLLLFWGKLHTSKQLPWILDALYSLLKQPVSYQALYVGPDTAQLKQALHKYPAVLREKIHLTGVLPEAEVSRILQTVDWLLYPLDDGASTRRGALLAAIQHGTPTLTTIGKSTDKTLKQCPNLVLTYNCQQFLMTVQQMVRQPSLQGGSSSMAMQAFFEQHYTWQRIAQHLLNIIGKAHPA